MAKPKIDINIGDLSRTLEPVPVDVSEEAVTAYLRGKPTRIPRGEMSDKEWERTKARVAEINAQPGAMRPSSQAERESMAAEDEKQMAAEEESKHEAERLAARRSMIEKYIVPGFDGTLNGKQLVKDPDQLKLMKEMSPSAQAIYIDKMAANADAREGKANREAAAKKAASDAKGEGPLTPTEHDDLSKELEIQGAATPASPRGGWGMSASARNPMSAVSDMATGAMPSMDDAVNAAQAGASAQQGAVPELLKSAVGAVDQAVLGPSDPSRPGLMQEFGARAAREAGLGLSVVGDRIGAPNLANMGLNMVKGADPTNGMAQTPPPPGYAKPLTPGAPTAPEQAPPTGSASASMQVPGGNYSLAYADPKLAAEAQRLAKAAEQKANDFTSASQALSKAHDTALEETKRNINAQNQAAEEAAAESMRIKQTYVTEAERVSKARDAVLQRASEAASTPIDPNRYWNNKSDGQRAMAVVAGALFGFTGQGMQWLQRLDNLVSEDNRLQESDRASKVAGLNAQASNMSLAVKEAMERGATLAEAKLIERDSKYQSAKSYLDQMAMTTQNMDVKMRAMDMSAQLGQKLEISAQNALDLSQQNAAHINAARAAQANTRLEAYKLSVGGGKAGEGPKGPQAMELGGLAAAERVSQDLKKQFGEKNVISRFFDKGAALIPGTSANQFNIARDQAINMIAPMMGAGVLQAHDLKRWEDLMATSGDLTGEQKLDILVKDIQGLYNAKRGALQAAGMDMSKYPVLGGN